MNMHHMNDLRAMRRPKNVYSIEGGADDACHCLEAAGMTYSDNGSVMLAGNAARLYRSWETCLRRDLRPYYASACESPAFIAPGILEATGYADHFPQHVIRGSGLTCTPAACFHVYPLVDRCSGDGYSTLVTGPCARFEDGTWNTPFRLSCFHMTELVIVGSRQAVAERKRLVMMWIGAFFERVGLPGTFETAVDAFYLGTGRGARLLQQVKGLKKEFRTPIESGTVAVASVNDHEDYFGRRFDIRDEDGKHAHSMCAAFGLERLTAAGLLQWGLTPADWPAELRS